MPSDALASGAPVVTSEFLQDLNADAEQLKKLGEIVTSCLEAFFCSDPAVAGEHLGAALRTIEACTARSWHCLRDVRESVATLRGGAEDLSVRDRELCLSALLVWLQRPGSTIEVGLESVGYCRSAAVKSGPPSPEDIGDQDPWSFKWIVDVVAYDNGFWALDAQSLAALLKAEDVLAKPPYNGRARVRIWPLNSIVKLPKGHADDDHVLATFVRLVTEEVQLKRERGDARLPPVVPAAAVSDSPATRDRSRSPIKKSPKAAQLGDVLPVTINSPTAASITPPKPPKARQVGSPAKLAADTSVDSSRPEEVRQALHACDNLALVKSNAPGGAQSYHAARILLEEAAKKLEDPLKDVVEKRLAHMRSTFKANTAKSYRSVCHEIRELLAKSGRSDAQTPLFAD